MSRGTALSTLLIMCRAELGYNTNSTTDDVILTGLLNNKQLWYESAFAWPFLRDRVFNVALAAGQRFYSLPSLNYEAPVVVSVYWNQIFRPLVYGIHLRDYNFMNSLLTPPQAIDPCEKWMIISGAETPPGIVNSFEVWPVPASANQTLVFTGQQVVTKMITPSDTALLDDLLLVKAVCGDLLTKRQSPDGGLKLKEAAQRFTQLQSAYPQRDSTFLVGNSTCNSNNETYPRWKPGDKPVLLAPG